MTKALLALLAAAVTLGAMAPAYADDHDHHRPVCHKVMGHHHWENRCH